MHLHAIEIAGKDTMSKGGMIMCDLKAYLKTADKEEMILESVNFIRSEHGEVILKNLFGEERKVLGEVREISMTKSRLVVEQT